MRALILRRVALIESGAAYCPAPAGVRGPRRLVLGLADRGAHVPAGTCRAGRRRKLRRPSRGFPLRVRRQSDHAGAKRQPRGKHVALSHRPHRSHGQYRGLYRTEIVALSGSPEMQLERVRWRHNPTGEEQGHPIRNVFLFIGADPATNGLRGCGVTLDGKGFVRTGADATANGANANGEMRDPMPLESSIPGRVRGRRRPLGLGQARGRRDRRGSGRRAATAFLPRQCAGRIAVTACSGCARRPANSLVAKNPRFS